MNCSLVMDISVCYWFRLLSSIAQGVKRVFASFFFMDLWYTRKREKKALILPV